NERETRSLSLYKLEKRDHDPAQYSNPPRVKTLGLRGCDISGIRFHDCLVPESSRVGAVGEGLELALRAFQVTRTLCAGLSLAAADTALRVTMDFAVKRKLYGGTVFTIPMARRMLSDAFLDMLICDCMATAAARGLHVSTEQFSVWSAVVKYFVPVTLERATQQLSVVLGARHFIRERHHSGIFQKMLRDGGVVSLFDGSTQVCLHALGLQLRHLVKTRRREQDGDDTARSARLTTIFCLDETLPVFDGTKLDLFSRGHDDVMQGLLAAVTAIRDLHDADGVEPALLGHLQHLAGLAAEALHDFDTSVDAAAAAGLHPQSPELFDLAARYAALHAVSACLKMWLHNRSRLGTFFADGAWLVLVLERLLSQLRPLNLQLPEAYRQRVADRLAELFNENRLFSIVPLALAKTEITADSIQKEDSHERQCN
ncbi:MAG: acyl-CoA dehydrogenase, partial [Pseudomonadota bacterium]